MIRNLVQCGCAALLLLFLAGRAGAQIAPAASAPTRAEVLAYMKEVNKVRPGLGDDEGEPLTTPFTLPPGLRVMGDAVGADENGKCPDDGDFGTGVYRDVQVCLPVCYVGTNVSNVVFPPGLIITTASEGFQKGLLVEREVIPVPPIVCNAAPPSSPDRKKDAPLPKGAFWIKLSTFCLNESQNPASSEGRYRIAGVTADPDLLALAQFVSKRDLRTPEANKVVQQAIYSITERKGLKWEDRKALHELPLKR